MNVAVPLGAEILMRLDLLVSCIGARHRAAHRQAVGDYSSPSALERPPKGEDQNLTCAVSSARPAGRITNTVRTAEST
jgi:hypothetical protein